MSGDAADTRSGERPAGGGARNLRAAAWLALLGFALYALSAPGYVDNIDSELQLRAAARWVDEGTPGFDAVPERLARLVEPGRDGALWPQFGVGSLALRLPAVLAGRAVSALTGCGADGASRLAESFTGPVWAAAALAFVFLLARRIGLSRGASLGAAALHGGATYALVYARSSYYETPLALCLVAAAWLLTDPRRGARTTLAAGALAGFAVTVKLAWLIAVPWLLVLCADGTLRGLLRRAALFAVPLAAAGAAVLWWNAHRFGDALVPGYSDTFGRPLAEGLARLLVRPHASYLLFSPALVLAVPGLVSLWTAHRRLAVCAAGLAATALVVFAKCWWPEGGSVHGARYLVPVTPFLSLAAAAFVARRAGIARRAGVALVGVSALVQLPGVLVAHQDVYRVRTAIPRERRALLPPYPVVQAVLAWEKVRGRDDPYDLSAFAAAAPGTTVRMPFPQAQGVNWWWVREARNRGRTWALAGAVPLLLLAAWAARGLRRSAAGPDATPSGSTDAAREVPS